MILNYFTHHCPVKINRHNTWSTSKIMQEKHIFQKEWYSLLFNMNFSGWPNNNWKSVIVLMFLRLQRILKPMLKWRNRLSQTKAPSFDLKALRNAPRCGAYNAMHTTNVYIHTWIFVKKHENTKECLRMVQGLSSEQTIPATHSTGGHRDKQLGNSHTHFPLSSYRYSKDAALWQRLWVIEGRGVRGYTWLVVLDTQWIFAAK